MVDGELLTLPPSSNGNSHVEFAVIEMEGPPRIPPTVARKVCIVGFAEFTRDIGNHQADDVEVWALNRTYTILKRWSRWYELHESDVISGHNGLREPGYLDLLRKSDKPVYMQHPDDSIPQARQFPKAEIVNRWRDYFTSSIALMLAHAAWEHVNGDTIQSLLIVGIDMSSYGEYSQQRPCVEYWLGILEGLGIDVQVPLLSPVLKTAIPYGQRHERESWAVFDERMAAFKVQISQILADSNALSGAVAEYDPLMALLNDLEKQITATAFSTNTKTNASRKKTSLDVSKSLRSALKKRRAELAGALAQQTADLNGKVGAFRECQQWGTIVGAPQKLEHEPEMLTRPQL